MGLIQGEIFNSILFIVYKHGSLLYTLNFPPLIVADGVDFSLFFFNKSMVFRMNYISLHIMQYEEIECWCEK